MKLMNLDLSSTSHTPMFDGLHIHAWHHDYRAHVTVTHWLDRTNEIEWSGSILTRKKLKNLTPDFARALWLELFKRLRA